MLRLLDDEICVCGGVECEKHEAFFLQMPVVEALDLGVSVPSGDHLHDLIPRRPAATTQARSSEMGGRE